MSVTSVTCSVRDRGERKVVRIYTTTTPTDSQDDGIRCEVLTVKENAIFEIASQPFFGRSKNMVSQG